MSGGTIFAAWVQAVPVWVAAGAAIFSLNAWRRQRVGERLLDHAEKALGSGRRAFMRARVIRSRVVTIPEEEAEGFDKRQRYLRAQRAEYISNAWTAWAEFQGQFSSARMFTPAYGIDVAQEIFDCLTELDALFRQINDYEDVLSELPSLRKEIVKLRVKFLGTPLPGASDTIGDRLDAAEAAMEKELRSILQPPSLRSTMALSARRLCLWP